MIDLKNIDKIYETEAENVHALKSVNLEIDQGEFISIMGQSGSGKTTLMNILGCLDNPTSGDYFIQDSNVSELNDDQRSLLRGLLFGFVFQSYNLLPRLNALEQVELPLIYQNIEDRRLKAAKALDMVGLIDRIDFKPNQLSGGQQQRVSIARSLINSPDIIFADEPTGNLDSENSKTFIDLIRKLNKKYNQTFVIVTHNKEFLKISDYSYTLKGGEIKLN